MELGMDVQFDRLLEGTCICDVLVKAPPKQIAAYFGQPVLVFEAGKFLQTVNPRSSDLVALIGKPKISDWCYVEINSSGDEDGLVSMCKQAIFAIIGNTSSSTHLSYETPVSTAATLSVALQAPTIALWGSDGATFIGGGTIFDQAGQIQEVYSLGTPVQLRTELHYIRDLNEGLLGLDDDSDDLEEFFDIDEESCYKYIPGQEAQVLQEDIITVLHDRLLALRAAQPLEPLWQTLSQLQPHTIELPQLPDSLREMLEPVYGTFEAYEETLRQELKENRVKAADIDILINHYRQKWFGIEASPPEGQAEEQLLESDYEAIWVARVGD